MIDRMIYQVDETRERILAEAEKLFREKGFFETQMKDIAGKTGMSRNTLYRYYRDKSDLALTIIESRLFSNSDKFETALKDLLDDHRMTGLEKFKEVISNIWLEGVDELDGKLMAEFDAYYSGSRLTEEMKEKFVLFDKGTYIASIVAIIDQGKEDGSIRRDVDSHLAFVTILNGVRALKQRVILRGEVLVETIEGETGKMAELLFDLLMEGLKNRSS